MKNVLLIESAQGVIKSLLETNDEKVQYTPFEPSNPITIEPSVLQDELDQMLSNSKIKFDLALLSYRLWSDYAEPNGKNLVKILKKHKLNFLGFDFISEYNSDLEQNSGAIGYIPKEQPDDMTVREAGEVKKCIFHSIQQLKNGKVIPIG
jgi:hypothetical protein